MSHKYSEMKMIVYIECKLATVCPEGTYGNNCTSECTCTGTQICDNVVGCCDPEKDECRTPSKYYILMNFSSILFTFIH